MPGSLTGSLLFDDIVQVLPFVDRPTQLSVRTCSDGAVMTVAILCLVLFLSSRFQAFRFLSHNTYSSSDRRVSTWKVEFTHFLLYPFRMF